MITSQILEIIILIIGYKVVVLRVAYGYFTQIRQDTNLLIIGIVFPVKQNFKIKSVITLTMIVQRG